MAIGLINDINLTSNGELGIPTELASTNSYARVYVGPTTANWSAATANNGTTVNNLTITFPTATGDWGTANGFGIWDSNTNGNLLVYAPLSPARTITNGSTASFAAGALTVQVDN